MVFIIYSFVELTYRYLVIVLIKFINTVCGICVYYIVIFYDKYQLLSTIKEFIQIILTCT